MWEFYSIHSRKNFNKSATITTLSHTLFSLFHSEILHYLRHNFHIFICWNFYTFFVIIFTFLFVGIFILHLSEFSYFTCQNFSYFYLLKFSHPICQNFHTIVHVKVSSSLHGKSYFIYIYGSSPPSPSVLPLTALLRTLVLSIKMENTSIVVRVHASGNPGLPDFGPVGTRLSKIFLKIFLHGPVADIAL